MALAIDASSPVGVKNTSTGGAMTVTTASFTPPAGSVIVALASCDNNATNATPSSTSLSGGSLTWTNVYEVKQATQGGYVAAWWATNATSSAMTVSWTGTLSGNWDGSLKVFVLTGADTTTPIATSGSHAWSGTATTTMSVTNGTRAGGLVFAHAVDWNQTGIPTSTDLGTLDYTGQDTGLTAWGVGHRTATSASTAYSTSFTFGSASAQGVQAALIVQPSAATGGVTITGVVATATATAPAGTVSAQQSPTVAGPVATVTATAPAGAVAVGPNIAGPVSTAAAAAPAGTVSTTSTVTLAGPAATAAATAPAGTVTATTPNVTIAGPVATAGATAPAGAPSFGVPGILNPLFPGYNVYPQADPLYPGWQTADQFTVYAYDICTQTPICTIPANGLRFDKRLNESGAISFDVDLLDPKNAKTVAPFLAYRGQPVALYVDRDGELEWGGWSTAWNYQHSRHVLSVLGKEWPDYFGHRLVAKDYTFAQYPSGVDPAKLLATVIADVQNLDSTGNVGINVLGGSSVVPWVTPNYTSTQSTVGQVISDTVAGLTVGDGGIDVWCDVAWSGGAPAVTLRIDSPRAGRYAFESELAIDLLRAVDFTWPVDNQQSATTFQVTGAGSGKAQPKATVTASVVIGGLGGIPRMDRSIQFSTVTSPSWLAQLAQGAADELGGPIATPTITLTTRDANCPFGSYKIGDDFRLWSAPFELFPGGIDETWRLVAYSVVVPDDGVPTVTLTMNRPPDF